MDEKPCYFVVDELVPIPMSMGHPLLEDYSYGVGGSCSVFMFVEPLKGWRHAEASLRRTKLDWAYQVERLLLEFYQGLRRCVWLWII